MTLAERAQRPSRGEQETGPGPVKFLLVDDREENLISLEALLRREGLQLLLARSGPEALELLLAHEVALALIDVQMPEMDGFELAELMRGSERTRRVPIIFITAGGRDQRRVFQGYEAGAVDFLFKPIEPHILKSKAEAFFQLAQQKQQLVETLRLNQMFTAVLGHDLRGPLSVMMMSAEAIGRRSSEEGVREIARRMSSTGRRMARMIDDLLDFARARLGGGIRLRPRPVDLQQLAHKVLGEHRLTHPRRLLSLSHEGDARGYWDEDRLYQVLCNLVGNALRHSSTEAAPIQVRVEGAGAEVRLSVSNAGVIPEDLLPRLFDPFHTTQSKSHSEGLGLGLYIVQQIVEAHGGAVEARSSAEEGTTFTISLPRRR